MMMITRMKTTLAGAGDDDNKDEDGTLSGAGDDDDNKDEDGTLSGAYSSKINKLTEGKREHRLELVVTK